MKKTVTLNLANSTKRTHVYTETLAEGEVATFPTIYVQKSAVGDKAPPTITVTIETPDARHRPLHLLMHGLSQA